MMLYIKRYRFR